MSRRPTGGLAAGRRASGRAEGVACARRPSASRTGQGVIAAPEQGKSSLLNAVVAGKRRSRRGFQAPARYDKRRWRSAGALPLIDTAGLRQAADEIEASASGARGGFAARTFVWLAIEEATRARSSSFQHLRHRARARKLPSRRTGKAYTRSTMGVERAAALLPAEGEVASSRHRAAIRRPGLLGRGRSASDMLIRRKRTGAGGVGPHGKAGVETCSTRCSGASASERECSKWNKCGRAPRERQL